MIRLIVTGGTLDKRYNPLTGELDFKHSLIDSLLQQANCTMPITMQQLMLKDSLDMNESDRMEIKNAVQSSQEQQIIITHGTDTMVATAQFIAACASDKTILFCGAIIPASFGGSDALFNLGAAVTAVQLLPPGVYISMNGRIFSHDNVQKNYQLGQFQTSIKQ